MALECRPVDCLAYADSPNYCPHDLGASLGTHYLLTAILAFGGKEEAIKNLNSIFNAWLPAVSSLVSAAVTYYFTKEKA